MSGQGRWPYFIKGFNRHNDRPYKLFQFTIDSNSFAKSYQLMCVSDASANPNLPENQEKAETPGPDSPLIGNFVVHPGTVIIVMFPNTCFGFRDLIKPTAIQHKDGTWLSLREWKDAKIGPDFAMKFRYEILTETRVYRRKFSRPCQP